MNQLPVNQFINIRFGIHNFVITKSCRFSITRNEYFVKYPPDTFMAIIVFWGHQVV